MGNNHLDQALSDIVSILGDRLSVNKAVRGHHGCDESWHKPSDPDAVCFANTTEEVSQILVICNALTIPVIPFGAGTGLEGQVTAPNGGICIDLSNMNEVLRVSSDDLDCTVQAGVTRKALNHYLRETGLFFPIDPGADASIGGMASTRASGTNAVRYGTMKENILSLKVVMPDGRIIETGSRARKSSAGYDLTRIFIGAEGTLGVITEITLRLHPVPEAISSARVQFPALDNCVRAVITAIQCAIPVARLELLDAKMIEAINRFSKTNYPHQPTLFVEFHGSEAGVVEQSTLFGEVCTDNNGSDFQWTTSTQERNSMWQARHNAAYAAMASRPGAKTMPTDVCVPISKLAECIEKTIKLAEDNCSLPTMLVGHVGDGNFHFIFIVDPESEQEIQTVKRINSMIIDCAIELDGTCTGEHGIGLGKREALIKEHGLDAVQIMKSIKEAFDPNAIMNPGKIFLESY